MDGWIDKLTGEWMDKKVDIWIDGYMDGLTFRWMGRYINGWVENEWIDAWMDG